MKRVVLVQPSINPPGGGNAVAAWMLQALRGDHALTLLSWLPPDLHAINRYFGTALQDGDFEVEIPSPRLRRIASAVPVPLAMMKSGFLRRTLARFHHDRPFDVLMGANNEFDFGVRGIQYIHYPAAKLPRPALEQRWYHRPPGFVGAYRGISTWLSGASMDRIRSNLTLVNSAFIANEIRALHGIEATIVHPPVPGVFPESDWADRQNDFVCVGRISPEKDLEKVIAILAGVRARGHTVRLHLVGALGRDEYAKKIRQTVERTDWVDLHIDLARSDLIALMARNRYGIHGMVGEHFGIAVAELQLAGCIPFVPDDAGPAEIIDADERIAYASVPDAVAKIDRVLRDNALCAAIRADCAKRKQRFSSERFVREIRAAVRDFGGS